MMDIMLSEQVLKMNITVIIAPHWGWCLFFEILIFLQVLVFFKTKKIFKAFCPFIYNGICI